MFPRAGLVYSTVLSKFANNMLHGRPTVNPSPSVAAKLFSIDGGPIVKHDYNNQYFFIPFKDGNATLKYELDENVIRMYSTYVPPSLEGRGIAAILVKEALEYSERNSLQILVECAYIKRYIKKYEPHLRHFIVEHDHE